MLDTETKRRIDTARDILVGKVPDPKSQVEQITIALIYKFMDDMDREAEELGGERTFFSGEFEKFAWNKIFDPKIGGHELLSLYGEALLKLNINPNIPQLFRDIFKNAYLPYRDPETLKAFLKVIDEFTYDHSERLGDAFEYLLSVLGSQGSAGQFRTPRHIIDFMVEIIDPKKDETILDPACGTAGFLISSYKYILKHNSSNFEPDNDKTLIEVKVDSLSELTLNSKKYKGDKLTPDERARLADNISGYDISPDMIRLSLVNMYLHGLNDPDIFEYDTLTSEDNWNKYANVILANPPFMSPKGGIRPHNRFTVKSNRSEVLFVDYMAEHLTSNGRAAIIVPEGIIFQSGTAYKQLRKMLVDDYLVGVISLPAGVFNPYSGVKTSIIWLDKTLAKKTNNILFVKIAADGFDLGAQRRPIKENSLPEALKQIGTYKQALLKSNEMKLKEVSNFLLVERSKIAKNGDYNLSGERYKNEIINSTLYQLFELNDIFEIQRGGSPRPINDYLTEKEDGINWIKIGDVPENSKYITKTKEKIRPEGAKKSRMVYEGDFVLSNSMSFGRPYIMKTSGCIHDGWLLFREKKSEINKDYIYSILTSDQVKQQFEKSATGGVVRNLNIHLVKQVKIPLPPLSVQQEIVSEIEGYQKIIDGARMVVENYKPQIKIDPEWEMVELGDVCEFKRGPFGGSLKKEIFVDSGYCVYEQSHAISDDFSKVRYFISKDKFKEMEGFELKPGDLIMSCSGTMGKIAIAPTNLLPGIINQALLKLTVKHVLNRNYLKQIIVSDYFQKALESNTYGAAIKNVASVAILKQIKIPLPNLDIQEKIVASINREQSLINSNIQIIELYAQKIKDRIAEVWGE